jgi:hypothetical protein
VPPYFSISLNLNYDHSEQTANPSQPSTLQGTQANRTGANLAKSLSAPTLPQHYFFVHHLFVSIGLDKHLWADTQQFNHLQQTNTSLNLYNSHQHPNQHRFNK